MAFLALTSGQCDANSPVDETLMQLIRTDLDDHESRIGANESISDGAIRDDFIGTAIDTDTWDTAGVTAPAQDGQPDHWMHLQNGAGNSAIIAATTKRMRCDLDRNHAVTLEARLKTTPSGTDANMFFGFQESGLTLADASVTDTSDMIGFVRGTNANTWKFRTAKASTNSEVDNLGSTFGWQVIRITIASLSSGADITIHVYIGDTVASLSEISGSPFIDETKIPLVELRPFFGSQGGGGTRHTYIDYILAYWSARPLSA